MSSTSSVFWNSSSSDSESFELDDRPQEMEQGAVSESTPRGLRLIKGVLRPISAEDGPWRAMRCSLPETGSDAERVRTWVQQSSNIEGRGATAGTNGAGTTVAAAGTSGAGTTAAVMAGTMDKITTPTVGARRAKVGVMAGTTRATRTTAGTTKATRTRASTSSGPKTRNGGHGSGTGGKNNASENSDNRSTPRSTRRSSQRRDPESARARRSTRRESRSRPSDARQSARGSSRRGDRGTGGSGRQAENVRGQNSVSITTRERSTPKTRTRGKLVEGLHMVVTSDGFPPFTVQQSILGLFWSFSKFAAMREFCASPPIVKKISSVLHAIRKGEVLSLTIKK